MARNEIRSNNNDNFIKQNRSKSNSSYKNIIENKDPITNLDILNKQLSSKKNSSKKNSNQKNSDQNRGRQSGIKLINDNQ